ncbi:4-oxalocrotonate tautomerase family protein [Litoribacillus peritrichatus]|uniref:4-oxalocrotonate tautomerase-like domain-containing protein n=1 Tax=Litoribacillus peritrichatus TaxID=718191 RepID=A0ABP7MAT6_9GAMM
MPVVTIKLTGKPVTQVQKNALMQRTNEMLQEVLNKDPESNWVIIEEVATQNWGIAGRPVTERFAQANEIEKEN